MRDKATTIKWSAVVVQPTCLHAIVEDAECRELTTRSSNHFKGSPTQRGQSPLFFILGELELVADYTAIPPSAEVHQCTHVILVLPPSNRSLLAVLLLHQTSDTPVLGLFVDSFVLTGVLVHNCSYEGEGGLTNIPHTMTHPIQAEVALLFKRSCENDWIRRLHSRGIVALLTQLLSLPTHLNARYPPEVNRKSGDPSQLN